MSEKDRVVAFKLYLFLAGLFITSLVVSNLIFQKFFYWYPFGDVKVFGVPLFEISVGLLPYPITFLITDLISEIFGKKKANLVVIAGIFASFFSLGIIYVSKIVPATSWSYLNDDAFLLAFGNAPLAVLASMLAYLAAQFIDIHIYHFWKQLTQGKHLWLRNNFSTFSSQIVDTFTVVLLLCLFDIISWDLFVGLVLSGVIFKVMVALLDTPLLYLFVFLIRKRFKLKINEEIKLV